MKGFVYILFCADGSFYTGSTNDLESKMLERQNGKDRLESEMKERNIGYLN